ncbi:MAG: glycerate kinase [Fervidobacterium sp.]
MVDELIKTISAEKLVKEQIERISLENLKEFDRIILISIGKAAWTMAHAAYYVLLENGVRIHSGIVITKYKHSKGMIGAFEIYEAGHPLPDKNTLLATQRVLEITSCLSKNDLVLFLLSGGGSSLFEFPDERITLKEIVEITDQLLKKGANIFEINTIRKRLSKVKGGKFAQHVYPGKIISLILSDVIGDRLDIIASGPTYPDSSTFDDVINITKKYNLVLSKDILEVLKVKAPDSIDNVENRIIGNVRFACQEAKKITERMGYHSFILTTSLNCEAKEAGKFLAAIAKEIYYSSVSNEIIRKPVAIIAGGETVVKVNGNGKGGRNQELALAFAIEIEGLKDTALCSFGTDGTDGPTDAAGGIVDGETCQKIRKSGLRPEEFLLNNDSYNALKIADSLLITGPTGTNLNDIVILIVR